MSEGSRSVAASPAAHVTMSGRVNVDGVRGAIGLVKRGHASEKWLASAYGQPTKTSLHKLRRDAVAWVVREWELLGKVQQQ